MNRLFPAAPALLFCLLSGCGRGNEELAKQATRLGVYAASSAGMLEISQYGSATVDGFTQEVSFNLDRASAAVAGPVSFVTNLPNAVIDQSRVFLLPNLAAGKWHKGLTVSGDSKPIESSADAISGSIYKVTPELPSGATGVLCLLVKMPSGTPDRLYALQLK